MALIGLLKMGVALALGPSLLLAFEAFPNTVLGVLLAVSGVELATCYTPDPHTVHCHRRAPPLGALLTVCTVCGAGAAATCPRSSTSPSCSSAPAAS